MRNRQTLAAALFVLAAFVPVAQASTLSTLYARNNRNAVGGMNYFDLNVLAAGGITVTQLDVNIDAAIAVGAAFAFRSPVQSPRSSSFS